MRRIPFALAVFAATSLHAAITGHVATEEGAPLAGARVRAYQRETDHAFKTRLVSQSPERVPAATATTGDDGSFTLDAKRPTVDLLIDAPGRQIEIGEAADGQDAGTFILPPAKPRRGRVMFAGKGVSNALVVTARSIVARTDGEGYYDAVELATGGVAPIIIHPDFAIGDHSVFSREALALGTDATLRRGVAIRGRVVAEDRTTGIPNAVIRIEGWPLATSGEDGSFAIAHAPDRWRSLSANDEKRAGLVSRSRGDSYTIVLAPAATLAGTVKAEKTNVPLSGARVWIYQQSEYSTGASAITDARGNFSYTGLVAGSYSVSVTAPGFVSPPTVVDISAGANVQRAFSLSPLPRLSGIVVDEARKPVGGAIIHHSFGVSGVSAPDGRYAITVRPTGQPIWFIARKSGYAPAIIGPIALQSSDSRTGMTVTLTRGFPFQLRVEDRDKQGVADEPVTIARPGDDERMPQLAVVVCGDRRGIPPCHTDSRGILQMPLAEGKYEITVGGGRAAVKRVPAQTFSKHNASLTVAVDRGVEVSGRVTYSDGSPVDPTNIVVVAKEVELQQNAPGDPPKADGTFVLRNVSPGPVTLFARLLASARMEGPSVEINAPAKNVVLTMPKPIRVEGRVVDKDNNQPVRSFNISVRRYRGGGWGADNRSFTSDEGAFVLDDVFAGAMDLTVTAAGYAPATVSGAAFSEKTPATVQLERGAVIVGRVTSGSAPVAEADVSFYGSGRPMPPMQRNMVRTDSQGEFRFDSASTGEYTVNVYKKGFVQTRKGVEVTSGEELRVDIDLKRGGELRGRVVDSEGQPVAMARINARGSGLAPTTTSDTDGNFELQGIPDGTYTVTAEKSGFVQASVEDVDVSRAQPITLTLRKGGTITGRVTGLSEREMAMTRVTAGYGPMTSTRVDASGNFTITGVSDGLVRVQATVQGPPTRTSSAKTVEVIHGSAPPVDLDFSGSFRVTGRVLRAGAPLASAVVRFEGAPASGVSSTGETASDGRYDVTLSTPGHYSISVDFGPSGRFEVGKVNMGGALVYDIDVRGSALAGRVIDEQSGTPLPGVALMLNRAGGGRTVNVMSDSEGRFSVDLISTGRYMIRASKTRYASANQEVELREGVPANVELEMRQGERVGFRVVDGATGRQVENVSISVLDSANKNVQSGPSTKDDNGTWRVWVTPGNFKARVYARGYSQQAVDFTVPGPDVLVQMRPSGRIVLQGIAAGAVRARLLDPNTRKPVMAVPVPPAVFESVVPGSYQIELLDRDGSVLASKTVTLSSAETITVPMN